MASPPPLERSPSERLAQELGLGKEEARRLIDENEAVLQLSRPNQGAQGQGDVGELFNAAYSGRLDGVRRFLQTNQSIDIRRLKDSRDRTLLYSACRGPAANADVVSLLIQSGASMTEPSLHVASLPQHAAVQNYVESVRNRTVTKESVSTLCTILKRLREYGADFQQKNQGGLTALEELERDSFARGERVASFTESIRSEFCAVRPLEIVTMVVPDPAESPSWKQCDEHLKKIGLPDLVKLSIAENLWKPHDEDAGGHIISVESTALGRFCPNSGIVLFDSRSMELLVDMDPNLRIKLQVPRWPNECGGAVGSVFVNWEWRLGEETWVRVDDEEILKQLNSCSSEIRQPPHKYELGQDFVLRGDGPLDAVALRWMPSTEADLHDDEEDSEDDTPDAELIPTADDEHLVSVPLTDEGGADDLDPLAAVDVVEQVQSPPLQRELMASVTRLLGSAPHPSPPPQSAILPPLPPPPLPPPPLTPPSTPPAPPLAASPPPARPTRDQTIDFAPIPPKSLGDADFPLFAMASSGLPVTFACANPGVAVLSGHMVRLVGEGAADITASQAGGGEFRPARPASARLVVRRVERVSLSVGSRYLTAGHVKFAAALPVALGVQSASEFSWDPDTDQFSFVGTEAQIKRLEGYFKAFNDVDDYLYKVRDDYLKGIRKRCAAIRASIFESSPKLPVDDPVIGLCKAYFGEFRKCFDKILADTESDFEKYLTGKAKSFVTLILKDPRTAIQEVGATVKSELPKAIVGGRAVDDIKMLVLKDLLRQNLKPAHVGDKQQQDTFNHFEMDILRRAQANFALSTILRDYSIHKVCLERNLPFYSEAARDMLEAVRKHDVTVVRTATGSGKSTLMPLLLLASGMGYNRIAVTQPRRFAAESIQSKIEELHGPTICGFLMAGKSKNGRAPVVYITDGLLRTTFSVAGCPHFDVIVIDEVHERSLEIDACVALLAHAKKTGGRMPKVILSSATFDPQVIKPFKDAGATIADLEQKVKRKFKCVEHYLDEPCCSTCQICNYLRRSHHYLDVVTKLHGMLEKDAQLLCFLPSQYEVVEAVRRLSEMNLNVKPLYAQQNGAVQLQYVRTGKVFFSTNIAETSLTFPNLKYVVDLGKVQRPRSIVTHEDANGKAVRVSLMETVPASLSTLRQRSGRVGRTMDGDYVALYSKSTIANRDQNIKPKMELEQYEDLLFSLQCQLKQAVNLQFPVGDKRLEMLNSSYFRFPVLGGKKMADAFHAAQTRFDCGDDILLLAALRMSFQSKGLQELAAKSRALAASANGDVSIIISVLRQIDSAIPKHSTRGIAQTVIAWCNRNGLTDFSRNLIRAHRNYSKMKEYYSPDPPTLPHNKHKVFAKVKKDNFDKGNRKWNGFLYGRKNQDGSPNMDCEENYSFVDLKKSAQFSQVIMALAAGFKSNYFIHCQKLDGPLNYYSRATDFGDGGDNKTDRIRTLSSMHSKSVLAHSKPEMPAVVFALDFMLFGAEMPENEDPFRLGTLQLVEKVNSVSELPDDQTAERWISIDEDDQVPATFPKQKRDNKEYCVIKGNLRTVIDNEIKLRESLRNEVKVSLLGSQNDKFLKDQIEANLKQFSEDRHIFTPLKFLWSNMYGVKVEVHVSNPADPHLKVTGRRKDTKRFEKQLTFWKKQLQITPMVERPDQFMAVSLYRRPKSLPSGDEEFRERLRNITAPTLSESKVFYMCEGPQATRESRMEVVARIAVQLFGCRLCGGFVRDWIVNGQREHLPIPFKDWIEPGAGFVKYEIKNGVVPKDLDIELSMDKYFDVGRFVAEVRKCGILVDFHEHIAQRHVFVFETERGPFTADFIEPHFAVLHTLADFDVNTLCVVSYPDLIGLKMRLVKQDDNKELDVDTVISHCRDRTFITLRDNVDDRKKKMLDRKWTELARSTFIPCNVSTGYSVVLVNSNSPEFAKYRDILATKIQGGSAKLRAMYEIRSSIVHAHYQAMRAEFEQLLGGDINEQDLFHGTTEDAVDKILKGGFDDHFWKASGYFGRGAYFADDPNLSVGFTGSSNPRSIFVCSVLLGKIQDFSANPITTPMKAGFYPEHGFNSVKGCIVNSGKIREMEYIVYRYGQAKPKYLLRFDK